MGIQVFGGMQQAGGFKAALKEHREHHKKQGDQLNNLVDGIDHNDPRPAYVHQGYPMMLYKPLPGEDGQKIVMNADEAELATQNGWREKPYPVISVTVLDPATEKKNLLDSNNQLQSQLIQQQEMLNKLMERLEAMEKPKSKKTE